MLYDSQKARVDRWPTTMLERHIRKHFSKLDGMRVPLPLELDPILVSFLNTKGYKIDGDTIVDKHNRPRRLGSILHKHQIPLWDSLYQYDSPDKQFDIVFHTNRYDSAAMSTNRPWMSCMGMEYSFAAVRLRREMQAGVCVAYLVRRGDPSDAAVARIALRPFCRPSLWCPFAYQYILRPERKIYSSGLLGRRIEKAFRDCVDKVVRRDIKYDALYHRLGSYVDDGARQVVYMPNNAGDDIELRNDQAHQYFGKTRRRYRNRARQAA